MNFLQDLPHNNFQFSIFNFQKNFEFYFSGLLRAFTLATTTEGKLLCGRPWLRQAKLVHRH
jgi:hypothetical protein